MKNKLNTFLIILVIISIGTLLYDMNKNKLKKRKNTKVISKTFSNKNFIFKKVFKDQNILKKESIKIINIYGPISFSNEKTLFGIKNGADFIVEEIYDSMERDNILGLLLRINSPGGTVAASQEIYSAILEYKKRTKKPVIVSMGDIATSGGYYISSAADTIFANSGTLTGNIGVIMSSINMEGLFKLIGLKSKIYKSAKHKDIFSPYRDSTDEEDIILKDSVKDIYKTFVDVVKLNRGKKLNEKDAILFDGRFFTGNQSVKNGLIDYIGGYKKALNYLWKNVLKKSSPVELAKKNEYENIINKFLNYSFENKNIIQKFKQLFSLSNQTPIKLIYSGDE